MMQDRALVEALIAFYEHSPKYCQGNAITHGEVHLSTLLWATKETWHVNSLDKDSGHLAMPSTCNLSCGAPYSYLEPCVVLEVLCPWTVHGEDNLSQCQDTELIKLNNNKMNQNKDIQRDFQLLIRSSMLWQSCNKGPANSLKWKLVKI